LGSINVGQFVTEDGVFMEDAYRECCRLAVRALDNVIDTYGIPVDLVRDVSKANRRVGLGLMGLADALVHLRLPYDSCEGREAAANFMRIMKEETMKESMRLAKEKGVFINFSLSIHVGKAHVRNCALTSNAPTGSISMISDASSGIEPNFALVFEKKNIMGQNKVFYYTVRGLDKALKECGCYTPEILKEIHKTGTMQHIRKIPKNIRAVFRCSGDMCAADHVLMQAALQTYTDNAISKTVNFPNDATESDVFNVYILAWLLDCKGCTVYRSGSRNEEVLTLSTKDGTTTEKAAPLDFSDMETYDPLESAITPNDIVKAITKSTNARKELEDLSLFMETKLRSLLKVHSDVVCGENGLKRAIQIANAVLSTCRNARRIALVTNPTPVHTATPESVSPSTSSEEDESGGEDRRSPLLTESCDESVSPPRLKSPAKWEAACPECGEARLAFEEGCEKCYSCGWGKCNTAPLKRPTPAPVVAVGPGVSRETYIV
jgi:ribonucleoside-diphosphate reductase alpha chain